MPSFKSPRTARLENRMRFPLEVFDAVRAAFPSNKPVGLRVSATDWIEGGWDITQTIAFAHELKKRGVDWIDVSSGGVSPLQKIPLGPCYQVPLAQAVKEATGVTTIAVGLITEAKQAEEIVALGKADMVALARGSLRPALGLARRRRTRRRSFSTAAILALAALDAKGPVRRDVVWDTVGNLVARMETSGRCEAPHAGAIQRHARPSRISQGLHPGYCHRWPRPPNSSSSAKAEDPVRRGLSTLSLTSLDTGSPGIRGRRQLCFSRCSSW